MTIYRLSYLDVRTGRIVQICEIFCVGEIWFAITESESGEWDQMPMSHLMLL